MYSRVTACNHAIFTRAVSGVVVEDAFSGELPFVLGTHNASAARRIRRRPVNSETVVRGHTEVLAFGERNYFVSVSPVNENVPEEDPLATTTCSYITQQIERIR